LKSPKIFKLSDVTKSLQNMILEHYNGYFWIQAEIAKLNFYPRTGHCFPDLVERERGKIKAEIRSIIWSEQYKKINKKFLEVAKTELQDGMSVLLRGKLNFHSTYGFSIHIYAIDPHFTLGNMAKEKEDNIKQLKKLDLFDLNKKTQFPLLPKNLAIISYNTSKGYADFNQVMEQEGKRFFIKYQLFPSLLQGDGAAQSLQGQLEYIKKKWLKKFDLVLIIRGGGGDVGMNCYNDLQLCKTIATFPIPVITGIGHSTNQTIAELVAHTNTITPTQTAYFILEKLIEQEKMITHAYESLKRFCYLPIENEKYTLKQYQTKIVQQLKSKIESQNSYLKNVQVRIDKSTLYFLSKNTNFIKETKQSIRLNTLNRIKSENNQLGSIVKNLSYFYKNLHLKKEYQLDLLSNKIELYSPENTLKRGYSVVLKNGNAMKNIHQVDDQDLIIVKMHQGELEAEVRKKKIYE